MATVQKPLNSLFKSLIFFSIIGLAACSKQSNSDGNRIALQYNQTEIDFPPYTVHVNAFTTDQLSKEVALIYQIERSKNRALLNVSITKKEKGNRAIAIKADILAIVRNLNNQYKSAKIKEIIEPGKYFDAVYYIAEFPVANRETLIFDLDITPNDNSRTFPISFRQIFYTGE